MSFKLIVDKFHNNIEISSFENCFLRNPIFNRMHRILQNSTAFLVFPCSKTSRFEHSIGTLNYASEIFVNGLQNSSITKDYLEDKKELLKKIVDGETFNKDFSSLFRSAELQGFKGELNIEVFSALIGDNEAYKYLVETIGEDFVSRNARLGFQPDKASLFTFLILFQSARIHALLHDVGHLPFSHLFEFSLESFHNALKEKSGLNKIEKVIINYIESTIKTHTGGGSVDDQIHEVIGKNLIRFIFADIRNEICGGSRNLIDKGLFLFSVCLIRHVWEEIIRGKAGGLNSIYSITSSSVDADRLDYVQRDGGMAGLIRSTGNIDRIVKMFVLSDKQKVNSVDRFAFYPAVQSLFDIEAILRDRFSIYKFMVNHHAVKRSDYLLQRAIELIIEEEIKDNNGFSRAPEVNIIIDVIRVIQGLTSEDIGEKYKKIAYEFAQINDYWLITLLNKHYIRLVVGGHNGLLTNLLGEIFENRRKITSLWKRKFEYYKFSVSLGRRIKKQYGTSFCIDEDRVTERTILRYKELIRLLAFKPDGDNENEYYASIGFLVIDFLKERFKDNWTRKIESNFILGNCSILVAPYKNSVGIKDLYLVDIKDHKSLMKIADVSTIENSLEDDLKTSTRFFVYFFGDINLRDRVKQSVENSVCKIIEDVITQ